MATYWMSKTKIYRVYANIVQKCTNKNFPDYYYYWLRWIKNEWKNFEEFYDDMYSTYKEWLTIERKNVNWNYCKENCVWADRKEQANNKRCNMLFTMCWKTQNIT